VGTVKCGDCEAIIFRIDWSTRHVWCVAARRYV